MRKPSKTKIVQNLVARAAEISLILEDTRPLYRELDDITLKLIELEVFHAYADGLQMTLVDNFAEKNTGFRVARFKRYDIKVERTGIPMKELKTRVKKSGWDFPIKSRSK